MTKHSFIILIVFLFSNTLYAQQDKTITKTKVAANKIWTLDATAHLDFPAADMAKRFGTSYRIGPGIKYKTVSNWLFGVKFDFITGNKMREDSLLINVKTNQGGIIAQNGDLLNPGLFLRGYTVGLQVGKIFPILQINSNSGPTMIGSVGFMQYKINIFDRDNSFPQLRKEYKKGYDRLTNGIYLEDFIGYTYFAKNKLINFYAGLNFLYGFTQGRRDYLLDVGHSDRGNRSDILWGFKAGWVLPIYKKNTEDTYY